MTAKIKITLSINILANILALLLHSCYLEQILLKKDDSLF